LDSGKNLHHGFGHLATLLTYDPGNREWVELLERYLVAAGPDQESFIARGEKLYFGTEALRAYLWQKQNRLTDAVELLVDVTQAKPEARYLEAWALTWLSPVGAIESLSEPLGLRLLAIVLARFPEAKLSPLPRLREIQAWARLAQRFFVDRKTPGMATMLLAGLLRKAGLFDEAEAAARPSPGQMSDWHSATALGLALREKGDFGGAEKAFRQATQLDRTDVSAWLEAADMFLDQRDWQRAMEWYDGALKIEPKQICAFPSKAYCSWQLTNDIKFHDELVNLAKSGNQRAAYLYHRHFYYRLPDPVDATANVVRKLRGKMLDDPDFGRDGNFKITVSGL
jgi:tetratricopeptide (TPR) repeat protein